MTEILSFEDPFKSRQIMEMRTAFTAVLPELKSAYAAKPLDQESISYAAEEKARREITAAVEALANDISPSIAVDSGAFNKLRKQVKLLKNESPTASSERANTPTVQRLINMPHLTESAQIFYDMTQDNAAIRSGLNALDTALIRIHPDIRNGGLGAA